MGLETTGDFIQNLNESWPPGGDLVSEGDNHLRYIKHVLRNTFPNADRPFRFPEYRTIATATYAVLESDGNCVLGFSSSSDPVVISLPIPDSTPPFDVAEAGFRVIIVKTAEAGTLRLVPDPLVSSISDTINNLPYVTMNSMYDWAECVWTGSVWAATLHRYEWPMVVHPLPGDETVNEAVMAIGSEDLNAFHIITNVPPAPLTNPVTIALPDPSECSGRWVMIQRSTTHPVILDPVLGTVGNVATLEIEQNGLISWLMAVGTNWAVLLQTSGAGGNIAYLDVIQEFIARNSWSAGMRRMPGTLSPGAGAIAWNLALQPYQKIVLTGDASLSNPTGDLDGLFGVLSVKQKTAAPAAVLTFGSQYTVGGAPSAALGSTTFYLWHVTATNQVLLTKVGVNGLDEAPIGDVKKLDFGLVSTFVNGSKNVAHGLPVAPARVELVLECMTANLGYSVGAFVKPGLTGSDYSGNDYALTPSWDDTNVHVACDGGTIISSFSGVWGPISTGSWKCWAHVFP